MPASESPSTVADPRDLWYHPANIVSTRHLMGDIDPLSATFPLAAYCFMTGFVCVSPSTPARSRGILMRPSAAATL